MKKQSFPFVAARRVGNGDGGDIFGQTGFDNWGDGRPARLRTVRGDDFGQTENDKAENDKRRVARVKKFIAGVSLKRPPEDECRFQSIKSGAKRTWRGVKRR